MDILAARAASLGVDIRYGHEVLSPRELPDADLIVAADGANSRIRRAAGKFQTGISEGSNKYIWLASTKAFDCFTYPFVRTEAGWVWAYAYGFAPEMSTFIVECAAETWTRLGFAAMPAQESAAALHRLFAAHLDGHSLIGEFPDGTSARWQSFRTLTNRRWHEDNVVLLGDSAHTAHYSIGGGTRLAFEDAIALASSLGQPHRSLSQSLAAYESQRRAGLVRPLTEARCSARWFENLPRYAAWSPAVHRAPATAPVAAASGHAAATVVPTAPGDRAVGCPRRDPDPARPRDQGRLRPPHGTATGSDPRPSSDDRAAVNSG